MIRNTVIRRTALVLAIVLCLSLASVSVCAQEAEPRNIMRQSDKMDEETLGDADGSLEPFWGQLSILRSWVYRIDFHDTKDGAPGPDRILDFSKNNDKSVIGWYTPNELHIAADGKVVLPEDSSWLFAYFTNLQELNFNNAVDTSRVTKMEGMFHFCHNLKKVDVSCFDTANVTTMRSMFSYCERVEALDVSGFDTGKVEDFSYMFFFCRQVPSLDVSGFNTSSAKYMLSMFYRCERLKDLDISGFDTTNVLSKNYMTGYTGIY